MTGFLTLQDLGHGMGEGEGGEPGRVPYRPLMPPTILQSNDFFMRMKFLSIFLSINGSTRYSGSVKSFYAHFRH